MNCKDIVEAFLKANGFDGLVQVDHECGCSINKGDLFDYCDYNGECEPAYEIDCSQCDKSRGCNICSENPDYVMSVRK